MNAIILCGIQGAGKSSFCRERLWQTHIRLNLDMLRTRHREQLLLAALIEAKQPFVVDNTNPTPEERARYIQPARQAGFRIIGMQFEVPLDEALARNATRAKHEQIPEKGIRGTARRWVPCAYAEGFDELYRVRSLAGMNFQIGELTPSGYEASSL